MTFCHCTEHCHFAAQFAIGEQHHGTKRFHAAILAFDMWSSSSQCASDAFSIILDQNTCLCCHTNHNPMNAVRIGEASNPGPQDKGRCHDSAAIVAILNPTAIRNKQDEFQVLMKTHDVNTFCCSENTATKDIQTYMNKQFAAMGLNSIWSQPVPPQREKCNGQPSLRGRAGGTSIRSKWPCREGLTKHLDLDSAPDRLCHAILQ